MSSERMPGIPNCSTEDRLSDRNALVPGNRSARVILSPKIEYRGATGVGSRGRLRAAVPGLGLGSAGGGGNDRLRCSASPVGSGSFVRLACSLARNRTETNGLGLPERLGRCDRLEPSQPDAASSRPCLDSAELRTPGMLSTSPRVRLSTRASVLVRANWRLSCCRFAGHVAAIQSVPSDRSILRRGPGLWLQTNRQT